MTTITKAGASLVDHMNDDATEVNSYFMNVTRISPPPVFRGESLGLRLGVSGARNLLRYRLKDIRAM